jgi:regulator of sirC expression with transglutaminase-like and TPR domain
MRATTMAAAASRVVASTSTMRRVDARALRRRREGCLRASRSARARSFFGRNDAKQWLAPRDDSDSSDDDEKGGEKTSSSVDDALRALAAQRRGLTLFEAEMGKDEKEIDLLAAACYVAMHKNPSLNVDEVRQTIEEMARAIEERVSRELGDGERFPLRTIKTISRCFADELGFRGNSDDYYDPDNSCVDVVLRRKLGIPITLCLIYMEIAERVRVDGVRGWVDVGIPGHLLCRPVAGEDVAILVDPFNRGDVLFIEEVEDILSQNSSGFLGAGTTKVQIERSFFEQTEVRKKAFLTRMLGNLKSIYFSLEEYDTALQITEYMMYSNPYDSLRAPLARTMGLLYFKTERWMDSLDAFNAYAAMPDAELDDEFYGYLEQISRVLTLERDVVLDDDDDGDEE